MKISRTDSFLLPDWKLPSTVHALFTTRLGGESAAPYDSFNLATHVGDDLLQVQQNRQQLIQQVSLPTTPFWLDQQHTDSVVELTSNEQDLVPVADACWTKQAGLIPVVMTADCLPVLVAAKDGSVVAAIHAGWKGLAKGIISKTISAMGVSADNLTAWIGPAISVRQFEVGADVLQQFAMQNAGYENFFYPHPEQHDKFLADLPAIAETEMHGLGLTDVQKSGFCSFEQDNLFYSYRRDGRTGRMASLIWIEEGVGL